MRERGRYQLQLLKTRSSSGVGTKVELLFDVDSLRITDAGDEAEASSPIPSNILNKIKTKSVVKTDETVDTTTGEITKVPKAEIQSSKLKSMLTGLKST
jgi:hypothetical protein